MKYVGENKKLGLPDYIIFGIEILMLLTVIQL